MQKMRAMLAFIQFCVFFFIIGSRLPLGFSKLVSADYLFRELSFSVIITPRFVFVLGNAIVIILVLKSGNSLDKDKDNNGSASSDNVGFSDHHMMMKEHGRRNQYVSGPENKIRRSQSEKNMARVHRLKEAAAGKELRRQATFTCRKIDVVAATNEMSNEEFRRRVEAFIARQQRSLREEEFSSLLAVSCES